MAGVSYAPLVLNTVFLVWKCVPGVVPAQQLCVPVEMSKIVLCRAKICIDCMYDVSSC